MAENLTEHELVTAINAGVKPAAKPAAVHGPSGDRSRKSTG